MLSTFLSVGRYVALLSALVLFGCAGPNQSISNAAGAAPQRVSLPDPDKHILLIFNHGSLEEDNHDICWTTTLTVPGVIRDLSAKKINGRDIVIYNFCSDPTAENETVDRVGEPKIFKRVEGIEELVRSFEEAGVPADRIFLVGQSAGGWASLLVARRQNVKFNGVIAFGPAFAGKKATRSRDWEELRQRQAAALARASHINGLVYAYADDPYETPSDLAFLGNIPGISLIRIEDSPAGVTGGCPGPFEHRTAFRDCFARSQEDVILNYIAARLTP